MSYGGGAFHREGEPTVIDSGEGALSRCPDGADSNSNNIDFRLRVETPGASNECGCFSTADCPADTTVCTQTTCNIITGGCDVAFTQAPCSDGNACTDGDSCADGVCISGAVVDCPDDGNVCTVASCDSTLGCTVTNTTAACDDGDVCTENDSCVGGECSPGTPVVCLQDGNPCTVAACSNPAGCQPVNVPGECDDNDACTVGEGCAFGNCIGGTVVTCPDDGNPCTDNECQADSGCTTTFNTGPCDDSDPCTTDVCVAGQCESTPIVCDDGTICDNGNCVAPPLDCPSYSDCRDTCVEGDEPCLNSCQEQAGEAAVLDFDAFVACLTQQCPNAEPSCITAVQTETGACFASYVTCFGCEPQCAGKDCGTDACGGTCGTCLDGEFCNSDFQCVQTAFEKLVINEVDYDQPGADTSDFVELFNAGETNIALLNYTLEFINGATGAAYQSLNLGGAPAQVLAPGEYVVVAQQALAPNTIVVGFSIQNGAPDGLRLVGLAGNTVDSLTYEGVISGYTEGDAGSPADAGDSDNVGISRCDNGVDTDNNASDFLVVPGSPGSANICPVCEPSCVGKACGDDGCGGTCGSCSSPQFCLPSGNCIDPIDSCAGSVACAQQCAADGGDIVECLSSCVPSDPEAATLYASWRGCIEPVCFGSVDAQCLQNTDCQQELDACLNPCTANCDNKVCGDDGCGGQCGVCGPGGGV